MKKQVSIELKKCLWCGGIIPIGRKSPSEYAPIKVHKECIALYRWNRCARTEVKEMPERYCGHCQKSLVRHKGEQRTAWEKRIFCNKSCVAFARNRKGAGNMILQNKLKYGTTDLSSVGVTRFTPDHPRFKEIAAQYMR